MLLFDWNKSVNWAFTCSLLTCIGYGGYHSKRPTFFSRSANGKYSLNHSPFNALESLLHGCINDNRKRFSRGITALICTLFIYSCRKWDAVIQSLTQSELLQLIWYGFYSLDFCSGEQKVHCVFVCWIGWLWKSSTKNSNYMFLFWVRSWQISQSKL